jgi:hypothetical protein
MDSEDIPTAMPGTIAAGLPRRAANARRIRSRKRASHKALFAM